MMASILIDADWSASPSEILMILGDGQAEAQSHCVDRIILSAFVTSIVPYFSATTSQVWMRNVSLVLWTNYAGT